MSSGISPESVPNNKWQVLKSMFSVLSIPEHILQGIYWGVFPPQLSTRVIPSMYVLRLYACLAI